MPFATIGLKEGDIFELEADHINLIYKNKILKPSSTIHHIFMCIKALIGRKKYFNHAKKFIYS